MLRIEHQSSSAAHTSFVLLVFLITARGLRDGTHHGHFYRTQTCWAAPEQVRAVLASFGSPLPCQILVAGSHWFLTLYLISAACQGNLLSVLLVFCLLCLCDLRGAPQQWLLFEHCTLHSPGCAVTVCAGVFRTAFPFKHLFYFLAAVV